LADEQAVRTMVPNLAAIARFTEATDSVGVAVFAHCDGDDYQLVLRAFCPADGIAEDPVTGSANAAVAAWLDHKQMLRSRDYSASQGREIGRDGLVRVEVDDEGEVWIGGHTQTVVSGILEW
jgi:PhzF family phenazine biosynthesis protein